MHFCFFRGDVTSFADLTTLSIDDPDAILKSDDILLSNLSQIEIYRERNDISIDDLVDII